MHQRVGQALVDGFGVLGRAAPFRFLLVLGAALGGSGNLDQALGRRRGGGSAPRLPRARAAQGQVVVHPTMPALTMPMSVPALMAW